MKETPVFVVEQDKYDDDGMHFAFTQMHKAEDKKKRKQENKKRKKEKYKSLKHL